MVAPHAFASSHSAAAGDTDDNIKPASTAITAKLKTGTKFTAVGQINGLAITVTCTTATFTGKTPAKGLGPVTVPPPKFSGCKDSLGGTDTVATNSTLGSWQLAFKDGAEASDTAPDSTHDQLIITVPKRGASFKSNILSACTVIVAPNGPAPEAASYNDAGTAVATNDTLPVTGSGCTATTSKVSETLTLTPVIKDVS